MKYTEKIEINNYDVDMHGIMRPTSLIAKLEEIGSHQMIEYPPSNDDLRKEEKGFILSRLVMSLHKEIHEGDSAVGETWATDSRGLSFNRCYCLNVDSEVAAKVYTVWALLDINEKKLIRVEEYPRQLGGEADPCFEMELPLRVRMPKADEFCEIAKRTVYYSETDLNGHMNNTKYLNMLCDFVPEIEKKSLKGINISYVSEASLGDTLTVLSKEVDGVYYFKTIRSDGKTNCEAVMYF